MRSENAHKNNQMEFGKNDNEVDAQCAQASLFSSVENIVDKVDLIFSEISSYSSLFTMTHYFSWYFSAQFSNKEL